MEKNIIIREREIKQQLIDIINKAELPAFLLQYIFKELYEQLENLAAQQYNEAKRLEMLENKVKEENENKIEKEEEK